MRVFQQLPDDTSGGGSVPDLSSFPQATFGTGADTNQYTGMMAPINVQNTPLPNPNDQTVPQGPAPGMTPPGNPGGVNLPYGGTQGPPSPAGTAPVTTPQNTNPSWWNPQWLSTTNDFLRSPLGQLVGVGGATGLGMYEAARADRNTQALTNAISATGRPGQQLSDATYRQLTGGAPVPGPMGRGIAGATTAANTLYGTAGTYGTGNLTPAQQMQIRANLAAQNAAFMTPMGGPGGMGLDSSAAAMMRQQNENNAVMLGQSMVRGNIDIANAALQGANSTYNQLLNAALNQANLGYQSTANAVQQQLKNNGQVQKAIQDIISSIVSGYVTAQNPNQKPVSGGGQVAQQGGQQPNWAQNVGTTLGNMIAQNTAPQVDTSWMQNQDPMSDMNVQQFNPLSA